MELFKRACRVCGCTNEDCRQCIARTGQPCYWVEWDLCSACQDDPKAHPAYGATPRFEPVKRED